MRWTRLDARNSMILESWKSNIRFKSYEHERNSKFDTLVALEGLSCGHGAWWQDSGDCHEWVCEMGLWYIYNLLRYDITSCLVAWKPNLISCSGRTPWRIKNPFKTFVDIGLENVYTEFRADCSKSLGGDTFEGFCTSLNMQENPRWL